MKHYIKPETEILAIQTETLLSASGDSLFIETDTETLADPSESLSKGHKFDVWGTDEE